MKSVLVFCPTSREHRDLPRLAKENGIHILWDDFAENYFDTFEPEPELDVIALIEKKIAQYSKANLIGITSGIGYPGMSVVAVMAPRLGLSAPHAEAILMCQHKYYSRMKQKELVPEATPEFWLIDPERPDDIPAVDRFPVFLKPVKSWMSMNAYRIDTAAELRERIKSSLLPRKILMPFHELITQYTGWKPHVFCFLLEELLEGHQVSLEGYVFNGNVYVMGILDAVMFPGSFSFQRFQYPSALPQRILEKMIAIAERFIGGIDYGDGLFNIEMIYDPTRDRVFIVEVNPKIASQFSDLFDKVDGYSSYSILLESALGRKPQLTAGKGQFNIAGSCVLRTFEDKYVRRVPSKTEIDNVMKKYPDANVQVIAVEGKKLSAQAQDTASFRYGLVNIGADSETELKSKFENCKRMLHFQLEQVDTDHKSQTNG